MFARLPISAACSRLIQCRYPSQQSGTRVLRLIIRRAYATPGRPKSVVGEPSKPVKRAAKSTTTKASTAAGTKKAGTKSKTTTKAKAKTPVKKAVKKKPAKKAVAPKRVKKVLSPEKQTALKKATLKEKALKPPTAGRVSAFSYYLAETAGKEGTEWRVTTDNAQNLAAQYKSLTPAERERINHGVVTTNEANEKAYRDWVHEHTVEQIYTANVARKALNRLEPTGFNKHLKYPLIKDDRSPKRPATSYGAFNKERFASGEFKGIPVPEASKLIAQEWKQLSDEQKQQYSSSASSSEASSQASSPQAAAAAA